MSKQLVKIFTYVDGVNDTPFPNEENQLIIPEYSFSDIRMGSVNLTATAMYPTCLDDKWVTGKQYADFRGERYFIVKTPSSSKSNDDVRYKHDIEFVSERNILETIYFYDVVSDNTSVDRYVSNSTKVLFYGDVHELVARLNYSLEYSQVSYRVVVDAGITSEVKQVSLEDVFVFDAIQEIFNIFELPFYFVGKTCHVGFTDNAITHTFRYGKDYELLSINKTNANYKITNRVTGTGSSDNIQFYYPNPSNDRAEIEAAGGKWITPAGTLMPPIYRDTDGAERFYNAINKRYINPETGEYYVFENEFTTASQKEQIVTFEDIKPTIKNTLNAAGLRIDEIIDVAFDKDDNDEVDESTGDYVHSYFYVKLNRFSGDYGFNLFEQPIVGSDASIVMTSGNCNACTFQIGVIEVEEDGKTVFKNPVQVDKNGNIAEGNYADKVKPNNIQANQQDTTQNEVWIALKKDNTTFGMVMPNKNGNIRPSYGDSFVITNIDMPQTYIYKAENELEEAILKYMANNNSEKFTFSIKLSRIFLAENPAIEALINSSARIDLEYNGKYHQLYVSSYTYRSDSEVLPEITIELADTLTISKNSIQTSIDSVKQDIMNTIGGVDFLKQGLKYFLRKDTEDIARFFISFLRGIKIGNYVSGGDIGGIFAVDGNGKTFIETDFLKVRMKAYFETLEIINTGSIAGRQIITPGGSIKCIKVVDREEIINEDGEKEEKVWNFYRCYFLAEQDGVKVENRFRKNDQALSQDFNIKEGVYENVSNHYYWRLVVGVGDDYIDLSKTDADTKSDAPAIGDVICQLGHRDDKVPERQNAMIFSAVDLYSPSLTMYAGINSYSYVNKDYISYGVDKTTNKAFMNVYGDTYIGDRNRTSYMEFKTGKGLKIKGQLEVGSTIGNGSTIEDALDKATQDAIDAATEDLTNYAKEVTESLNNIQYQIDGQIESFFEKYSPTLTNKPAVDWTTEELKKQHANDTFTNIDTGESWKWVKDGTTWKWSVIEDTATLKALAAASKAQDTADGKRRVFVAKPTNEQVYDVGDLWVNATYGTTYHNDILRAKTAKKAGEAFNISHWELASKYTDDTKANEAAAAAAKAQEAAEQAATAVDNLNTYVDGAFKDGVIEESEAQAIEKYINIVDNAKKTTDAAYTKLYANTYLTGAAKTGLKSAKDKLDIATTNLINSINTAIADGQTTVAEKNDVDAKFAAYNTANEAFSTAVEVANGAIQDLLKSYSDQAKEAAVAAQAAADAAQAAADSASDAVDDLNGYVDGAFKDGVIDEAEAKAIEKYINVVNGSKAATDATYTKLYSNKYLLGTAKENLKTAKDKLDVATTALLTSIQSAIADGKTTAEEKAAVDAKYADFNKANEDFNTAIEAANLSIQNMLKSYADAALAAAEAAQTSADAAKTAADNAAGAVGDLNDYVDGAFKDGIIDASEAQAIEKYINIVNNTKGEVKATFNKLYANVYLTGAAKTGLNSSYTALNTAITNLLNSINTAIADGKTTAAEKADVDSKYASFNTAYSSFNTAVETANKAIQDKLKTFADDAKALAESAQAVADAAKDRLDSWAEDGVISPTEKQGIKDEIARIKADKDNITAGYLLYNLGEATAYNTAYTDYYNSLLALSDTTKETIEIPTDFATKQTKYYTERTAALNAIASASKSAVDAAQAAADAAKSRLDSWAADGVISPAEKQSIKDERARILADKADITTGYTRYNLGTPTNYNTAYTAYDTALAALSKDTPEVITIPSDFATKQKNYYTKRTAAISAIDAATKSNADAAAAAAAKAQEDIDNVKTDINKIKSDVAGLKNFTDDAFADGVVDRGEASAIGAYLKSIATVKADVDKSYTEVYANPLLAGTAKTTLNTTYTAFGKAVEELTTVIEAVVEKGIADATDRASVNGKYDAFNTKYGAFIAALNAANTYIQDQIESKAENALTEAVSYRYLKKAFSEYTIIEGGLVQNSLNVLGYTNDKKKFVVQAGMNGIYDASQTHGGIAAWYGGSMKDYFDYTDLDRPKDVAKGVDRMDGTGYRANGNLWWDENGEVHADPLSFFVGTETVGGLLASFQVVMTNKKPDYLIPKVPFQDLTISNNLTVGGDIILKDGILKWNAANNAFYVEKKDGSIASFYATGEVSAGGAGSGGSGGGGLIENVYGYSKLNGEYKDTDLNNTFNAYTIAQINKRVVSLEGGSALTVTTTGSGNAVTSVAKSGTAITVTKGTTFVDTTNPQTIGGSKTFSSSILMGRSNLHYVNHASTTNATGLYWKTANYAATQFGIGCFTTNNASPRGFIGWTSEPWQTPNSLTVSETSLTYKGKAILHSDNYNTYAPTKTGGGASGSWGISITGNAATATTATKLGTATIGAANKPIYLNAGTPTALSSTVGDSTVPAYLNAGTVTVCSWGLAGASGKRARKSGYITSSTASLSSYWGKIASFNWGDTSNDRDITLYIHSAFNSLWGTVVIRTRWSSATSTVIDFRIINGNIPTSRLRLYYDVSAKTNVVTLWGDVAGQWGVFNTYVLSETTRTSTETGDVTLYATSFTTAQTLPTSTYKEPTYLTIRNNAATSDVADKLGTSTVGSGVKPIYLNAGTATASTSTVGAANKGVYMSSGTITAMSSTVGSTTVPVYMNAGAITVCSTTLGVSITGNAKTATTLQTTRKIFSQPFSGAGDVAGQAFVYGTYQETASSRYSNGGLQIRENGLVGNKQTADGYAPAIGFHWANRIGASLILTTSGFKFMDQAFTGYQNVYGIFKGNADSATQVYSTLTNPTTGTWYVIPFHTGASTTNKLLLNNNGIRYYSLEGTASAQGEALIQIGNSTATGTAGNKRGCLRLYSSSSGWADFTLTATTGNYTLTLPAATGTVALTSSNVASATKLQTARTLWGQNFNGTANVSGNLTGVGNIISTGDTNIGILRGGSDATAVVLNATAFKPYDAATNKLNLGISAARWLGVYANTGNFSSTVTGTRFISTVATGTAPLTVSSTTVVTNLNADMVDGIHSSNIPLEYDASYKPTGTAARWIRIAYFDYSSASYSWSGTFAITNTYTNDENKGLIFTVSTAHGTTSPVITQIGGSGGVFTSIRIVKDTTTVYPTTAKVYLEVYYNSTSAMNYVYVSYKPANRAIGKWKLYTTYTAGSIPTGHTAIAQLYTTSGLSTTANLRVQGVAVILGATNHNNRLDIQSDGKIVPHSTATRQSGVYGVYDSAKIGHIWSMGTNYMIADDGSGFGNLYGFAYQYSSSLRAIGHQAVWCVNGNPRVAIGDNFWVANAATIGGTLTVTGAGSVNTLTIKNTEAVGHLKFSRGSFNYITAPASGTIAFIVNGQAVGEATADLIIQNGVLKAGAANATALGQDTRRWSNMYSVLLNVSGVATLSSTVNIAGVLNANNATDATSTTAAGAVFDGGVGIVKQLRVGGNVTIGGNVTFATSGLLSVPYSGGQWISMATRTNLIAGNQNTSEDRTHALYRVKSFAGDAVVFGGLKNSIGFYGFYKARIDSGDNGSDWATTWNTTTGALTHNKAMTVSGAVTFSSTLTVASTATFSSTTDATSTTAAAVKVTGGLGVAKQLRVGGAATLSSTLSVSSTLNVSGVVNANNATDATSTTAASLVCDGGVGIVKQLRVGGATTLSSTLSAAGIVSFTNATDATSTTAAAVKITGGLGVAKQLRVGSNAVFTKGIYINGNTTGDESITLGTSGDKKIKMGAGGSPGTRWSEIAFFPNFVNNGEFTDINLNIQAEGTIQISSQAKFIWISGGNIAASGEVSAGSTSDRNLKKNFSLEDYQQRVLDLGMVQDFEYREEEMKRAVRTYKPGRHTSLIAQDIKSCTSMVSKDKDGYLKINPLDKEFLFTVVGAVQLNVLGLREVKSEVEILKDEIKELKKRIEFLESLK